MKDINQCIKKIKSIDKNKSEIKEDREKEIKLLKAKLKAMNSKIEKLKDNLRDENL